MNELPSLESRPLGRLKHALFGGGPRRLAIQWGIALALAFLCCYFVYPPLDAWRHWSQAQTALEADDCALALQHLQHYAAVWPDSARCQFELARCSRRIGDLSIAQGHLQTAAQLGWPGKTVATEFLFINAQRELTPEAAAALENLFQRAKDGGDADRQSLIAETMALALLAAERREESAAWAQLLTKLKPASWRSRWLLGRALARQDPHAAAQAYRQSLAIKPDQPKVHHWLAIYAAHAGNAQECLRHLDAARPLDPNDVEACFAEAKARYLLGELAEARAALDRFPPLAGSRQAWPLVLRGLIELEESGPENAAPWLAKAEAIAPSNIEVLEGLIKLATRQGDQTKLQQCLDRKEQYRAAGEQIKRLSEKILEIARQTPGNSAARQDVVARVGELLFQFGEDEAGAKYLESVLSANPYHPSARRLLVDYYRRVGASEKAKALQALPAQP